MHQFTLGLLFQIIGIGSASGLFYQNNSVFIISDNSSFLYEYKIDSASLKPYPLLKNPTQNIPKASKPDFEAMAHFQDTLYIFGSASESNRTQMIVFDNSKKVKTATNDLKELYPVMQEFAKMTAADFNIEGVVYEGENWYFFNRGNGPNQRNTLFTLTAKKLDQAFSLLSNDYKLPRTKGVRFTFTDAVLVNQKLYFIATAEATSTTYADGQILGSMIGSINLETMKIDYKQKISSTNKFEGITLYKETATTMTFLLCEDPDTNSLQTDIYQLTIPKK